MHTSQCSGIIAAPASLTFESRAVPERHCHIASVLARPSTPHDSVSRAVMDGACDGQRDNGCREERAAVPTLAVPTMKPAQWYKNARELNTRPAAGYLSCPSRQCASHVAKTAVSAQNARAQSRTFIAPAAWKASGGTRKTGANVWSKHHVAVRCTHDPAKMCRYARPAWSSAAARFAAHGRALCAV